MKKVPLKYLKDNFAALTAAAAQGELIGVTKYHKPYIVIAPASENQASSLKPRHPNSLQPVLKKSLKNNVALRYLLEGREDRF